MELSVNGFPSNLGVSSLLEAERCVETDPTGRYIRYNEILGRGAFKTVYSYKGFDEVDGIEVAWNQVCIEEVLQSPDNIGRLYSEVYLLRSLKHENIIKFIDSWVDHQTKTINIITELFTSGSLRHYRKRHKNVDMKAIKNWASQILRGLEYLHNHKPPILHRDLKCDNIFVNGNNGEVKIGDLGLAIVMQQPSARSVIGTPEFMAPELYEEEYNELVDIYSFGMCMLEMITLEFPYSECKNPAQIFKKVTNGIKPAALAKVTDPEVRQFIEKCLVSASERLPAKELLKDPFLQINNKKESLSDIVQVSKNMLNTNPISRPLYMDIDSDYKSLPTSNGTESSNLTTPITVLEFQRTNKNKEFTLQGSKHDDTSVSLILRIADAYGMVKYIHFVFCLKSDTALGVAAEMVEQLELSDYDVVFIADFIDFLIMKLAPGWKLSIDHSNENIHHKDYEAYGENEFFSVQPSKSQHSSDYSEFDYDHTGLSQLNLKSSEGKFVESDHGRSYRKVEEKVEESMMSPTECHTLYGGRGDKSSQGSLYSDIFTGSFKNPSGYNTDVDSKADTQISDVGAPFLLANINLNSYTLNCNDRKHASNLNMLKQSSALSLTDEDQNELRAELDMIDAHFEQWFYELSKMREEAKKNARKKFSKKKSGD
ncbi:hypothetical protein ZIOFF_040097 [Zingiber officinale]|uniref:non-specific serine/threonine protein kinase n=1 Tax=Zingiber officinale TaxID=94328 RepID=A0A8J5GC45_ZINOF|nr:hypothetical protein ZIOFF_040097 [Zingiber officinale]